MEGISGSSVLDLNRYPAIQAEEDPPGEDSFQRQLHQIVEAPDLALNLQALSLSAPRVCSLQASQAEQNQEIQEKYMLLMKVACTGGTPRIISEHTINQAMSRAWRQHFYAISQVSTNLFMAYFSSQEDMMFVYTRQPWMMGTDNLLLEWVDPNDDSKTKEDYRFDHIYVTVRAYGIPKEARSMQLLQDILETVGEPSEFHPLQTNMIFSRTDYIWGMAKLKVMEKVVDKISLTLPDKSTTTVYLHYEKIGRICLFCGIMFHTVQHCPLRNDLIMERTKHRMPVSDIPFVRFGEWLLDPNMIPQQTMSPRKGNSSVLSRFQKMFSDEDEGNNSIQGKCSSTSAFHLPADHHSLKLNQMQPQQAVKFGISERLQLPNVMSQRSRLHTTIVHPPLSIQSDQARQEGSFVQKEMHNNHITQEVAPPCLSLQCIDMGGHRIETSRRGINNAEQEKGNNWIRSLSAQHIFPNLINASGLVEKRTYPQCSLQETPVTKKWIPDGGILGKPPQIHSDGKKNVQIRISNAPEQVENQETMEGDPTQLDHHNENPKGTGEVVYAISSDARDTTAAPIKEATTRDNGGNQEIASHRRGGSNIAVVGGDQVACSNQGNEPRRRASGWDIRPATGSQDFSPGDPRLPLIGSGGPIRNRQYFSKKMGNKNQMCRDRSSTMEKIGSPYPSRYSRSPARMHSPGRDGYDPKPIQTPSPSSSTSSIGSRYDGFPPPPMVSDNHMSMDALIDYSGTGASTKNQSRAKGSSDGNGEAPLILETQLEGDMDVDGAMAPALKAPQAP